MYNSTTDRYGNTVTQGMLVVSRTDSLNCCNIWVVQTVNPDGTVELAQPDGQLRSEVRPDDIIFEECFC